MNKISKKDIEVWADKNLPRCTCDKMYLDRKLTAPDCIFHNGLNISDLIDFAKYLGVIVKL
jgi:hypothetical protein